MSEASDTLVFIPAWNEEQNLPAVLDELRQELPAADVLVVDDGSTDGTAEVARGHGALVLSFGVNRGLRAGIAAGYGYALERGYAYCGRVDADGQHPAGELRRLLDRVRSGVCDVAVGSRFASGEGFEPYRYTSTGARRLGTALLRRSMAAVPRRKAFLGSDERAWPAGLSSPALPVLALPYTSGAPEMQSILRLSESGFRVDEVPVNMRERASGESKLQGKKAVMLVLTVAGTLILATRLRTRRSRG